MKYKIGDKIHGFEILQSRHINELSGDMYILRHTHSGAMLCYIDNEDPNMTYSITFATPSHDSTGVFHILEHSVLCGSQKYPVDDPFVELMKSSLYTFLNAMTFPDKTMYPVSSMNDKDLINLMSVYTDAVFRPLIYDNENSFRQEGWHIEQDENGKCYYQGVVYNEMKGALGDPDENLYQAVFKESYEPCQYTTVSGGHPDHIVKLSYADFIANHKKYYHPSNARFYLYGKMELESKLEFLDREYLSEVTPQEQIKEPKVYVKHQNEPYCCTYVSDSEKENEDYIALTYPIGEMPEFERYIALSILTDILADTNYDPLKKRILDKGLAVEVECEIIEDIASPLFTVKLRHCDSSRLDEIVAEITDCLAECADGLDAQAVKAKISSVEFNLREGSASGLTKGLYYNIQIADTWLYDYEPWRYLEYEEPLQAIKDKADNNYFENLIKEVLLNNQNRNIVVMKPSSAENRYAEPTEKPDGYSAENRKSDADPIPHLSLSDIDRKSKFTPTEKITHCSSPIIYHELKTEGIVYTSLYFDVADADDDELFYLTLLESLLTSIPTAKTDGKTLQTELGLYTGSMELMGTVGEYKGRVISTATFRYKALADKFAQATKLAQEILSETVFDDRKNITDIIGQLYTSTQLGFINNSSQIAATRAGANQNIRDAIADKKGGISMYKRLKALKEQLDQSPDSFDSLKTELEKVYRKFIVNGKAVASLTCDKKSYDKISNVSLPKSESLTESLKNANSALLSGNVALSAPCDIVFNGYSFNGDTPDSGTLALAKKILSLEYLWQKIRVENGAYGCGAIMSSASRLEMWSYRDPQIKSTLKIYDEAADFLSSLELDERSLEDYIISVIRSFDNPLPPRLTAYTADTRLLLGKQKEDIQRERDELLSASLKDLKKLGEELKAHTAERSFCTVGRAESIAENAELYDEIIKM